MSVRRALVSCTVLSLQDNSVFYPCCKGCFSKLDGYQEDENRIKCAKCGYWALKGHIDHRYRLSLRVTREGNIFGVTVFGNSLVPFFGITATGLHKLVQESGRPPEKSARLLLLVKAVQDCFIGRQVIFGLRFLETENEPWCQRPTSDGFTRREMPQFVASQMILPVAAGLTGCAVVNYYQVLLQKFLEAQVEFVEHERNLRLPATLRVIANSSATSSFNSSHSLSRLLSHTFIRRKSDTLISTPQWEQSLGIITSSAEQDGSCITHHGDGKDSRQTNTSPFACAQMNFLENLKGTEIKTLQLVSGSFPKMSPFSGCHDISIQEMVSNPMCTPQKTVSNRCSLTRNELSIEQDSITFVTNSLAWENCPFSESLTEFVCQENKEIATDGEVELRSRLFSPPQTSNTDPETNSPMAGGCFSVHTNSQTRGSQSFLRNLSDMVSFQEVTLDEVRTHHLKTLKKNESRTLHEYDQEDVKAFMCFEQEEQLEKDSYNCSADLFGGSCVDTETSPITATATTDSCTSFCEPGQQRPCPRLVNVSHTTLFNRKRKSSKNRNRSIFHEAQDFEFVPPSQSTPVMKGSAGLQCSASSRKCMGDCSKENLYPNVISCRLTEGEVVRETHRTPFCFMLRHQPRMTKRTLTQDSRTSICDGEDDGVVAPTPAKSQRGMQLQEKQQSRPYRESLRRCRDDILVCKRTLLKQIVPSTENLAAGAGSTTGIENEERANEHLNDENQDCDWSRDLFADSI